MKKYLAYFIIEASSKSKAEILLDKIWYDIDPNLEVYVRDISQLFDSGEFIADIGIEEE